jgi:hypothetical protein
MPETPQQPDKPTTVPTPEDPREKTPMQDPPLRPEHDDKTRIAGSPGREGSAGLQSDDDESTELDGQPGEMQPPDSGSPDRTVFDENRSAR